MNDFLEAWNRSADTYDAYADRFSQYEETSRFLVDVAGVGPGQTVVDLACGTGVTSGHILDKVGGSGMVVAVDFSEPMLEKARKNIRNGNIRFVRARAEELSQAVSGSVDAVVCNSAFWQFDDYGRVFEEIAAILHAGGTFAFNLNQQFYDFGPAEESHRRRVMEIVLSELSRRGYRPEGKLREKLSSVMLENEAERAGLSLVGTETTELPGSTVEDSLRFLSIPAVAPFFDGVPDQVRYEIIGIARHTLKDESLLVSPNRWIAFIFRKS